MPGTTSMLRLPCCHERPDLLLLSDLPWTGDAKCVGARLRAARHIEGLTSERRGTGNYLGPIDSKSWCFPTWNVPSGNLLHSY